MRRQITMACAIAVLGGIHAGSIQPGGIQPTAHAQSFAGLSSQLGALSSTGGEQRTNTQDGASKSEKNNKSNADAILREVSEQQYSGHAPQLDPSIAGQWVIAVFGSALNKDGSLSQRSLDRLNKALVVANNNPASPIVVSGGKPEAGVTEAQAMKQWLIAQGIRADRIVVEEQASDTVTNARNVSQVLARRGGVRGVMLITAADHIRRATLNFRLASGDAYDLIPVPAENTSVVPPVPEWERTAMERDIAQFG